MKRSEMVQVILSVLETWQDCRLDERTASEILDVIERRGMKPPFAIPPFDQRTVGNSLSRIENYKWEKE